ncbi:MAG: site-2 protease family protein [Cyanobacteria bacterium P01_A01_bin.84]
MIFWFIFSFLLLGIFIYLTVRSSAKMTKTPTWLLWLAFMAPAFLMVAIYTVKKTQPQELLVWYSIISTLLYWLLFQWGRRAQDNKQKSPTSESKTALKTVEPKQEIELVRPIEPTEETKLRNCFPWSVYYIHNIEYRPQAVICRGQLRIDPNQAYQNIKANIEAEFGDRFLLVFQEGMNGKPFFILVPNTQTISGVSLVNERLNGLKWALLLLVMTLFTTTRAGSIIAEGSPTNFDVADPNIFLQGLPYALGIITILGTQELGHYFGAVYYKIRASLPFFIPIPLFLGTLGAFVQIRSPFPHRKALFDVNIIGPLAGFFVTIPILFWGLANSQIVDLTSKARLFNLDALNPRDSILLAVLSKLALGSSLTVNSAIDLHPIAIAGLFGLIITALKLMPVGQLEGGYIIHAMFGKKTGLIIGQIARLLLLLRALVWRQTEFFLWAILLLFMPIIDKPVLNDVTQINNARDMWGLFALTVLILIVLPLPQSIAYLLKF